MTTPTPTPEQPTPDAVAADKSLRDAVERLKRFLPLNNATWFTTTWRDIETVLAALAQAQGENVRLQKQLMEQHWADTRRAEAAEAALARSTTAHAGDLRLMQDLEGQVVRCHTRAVAAERQLAEQTAQLATAQQTAATARAALAEAKQEVERLTIEVTHRTNEAKAGDAIIRQLRAAIGAAKKGGGQ